MTHRLLLPSKDSALDSSFVGLVLNTLSTPSIKRFSFELFLIWTLPDLDSSCFGLILQPGTRGQRKEGNTGSWEGDLRIISTNQSEANTQPNEAPGRQRTKMTTREGSGPSSSRDLPGKDLGLNSSRRDLVTAALVLGWVTCNYMQYNQ